MNKPCRLLLATVLIAALSCTSCTRLPSEPGGNVIDMVVFGDEGGGRTHDLKIESGEIITGGLGQPALRLLPLEPPSHNGGAASFSLRVDPAQQNYVTVRLWGSDHGEESGQLVLFAEGKQVGYRMQSDYDLLNVCDDDPIAPGRFIYETRPLPLWMTQGRERIELKISAIGRHWPYGQTFEKYQRKLEQPSRGIYAAYTHTNPRIEPPASEQQGAPPAVVRRSTHGPEVIEQTRQVVISRLNKILAAPPSDQSRNLELLSAAYSVAWTPAFKSPAALDLILAEGDTLAAKLLDGDAMRNDWRGAGPLGDAIARTWPDIQPRLDQPFPGDAGGRARRQVWADVLRKSVDYWRTHRRSFTNQAMIVDMGIYAANRGLQFIEPSRALPEQQALRYVREAVGLEPWMDSDIIDAGGERPSNPFGGVYKVVSRKNLSRELGWVGSYGETILHWTRELYERTGDEDVRRQLRRLQAARLYFRYPGTDPDGHATMKAVTEVCNRTSHFPYSGPAYSAAAVREAWGLDVAAMLPDDPLAVGVAQRFIADGQYFPYIASRMKDPDTIGLMRNVNDFEVVSKLPPVPYVFPMEDGQPDFVFTDEENAIVALKHGEARIFANFYFRAENAVNSVAKIMEIDPGTMRLVTARTETVVNESGKTFTRPDYINWIRGDKLKPPGEELTQAWAGEVLPVAKPPEGVVPDAVRKFGPYIGRADFYRLAYGDYVFAVNTTEDRGFDLRVPKAGEEYVDLVSGKRVAPVDGLVPVPPLTTVVLYPANSSAQVSAKEQAHP